MTSGVGAPPKVLVRQKFRQSSFDISILLMKLYYIVIECIDKSVFCHKKHIKCTCKIKIKKLFLVTSCFSM